MDAKVSTKTNTLAEELIEKKLIFVRGKNAKIPLKKEESDP